MGHTTMKPVEFWFDFASTYSYPAAMRVAELDLPLHRPSQFPRNGLLPARVACCSADAAVPIQPPGIANKSQRHATPLDGQIVEQGAHYILSTKDNQPKLAQATQAVFDHCVRDAALGLLQQDITLDKGHARVETRLRPRVAPQVARLAVGHHGRVHPRFVSGVHKGRSSTERRYYISSATFDAACTPVTVPRTSLARFDTAMRLQFQTFQTGSASR
jgi:hypothetical protein